MELNLREKPKGVTIISGFPGIGLVGSIAAEFLVSHLKARQIGEITTEKIPPIMGVHKGQLVDPFAIYYDEEHNLVIIRAVALIQGFEHELAEALFKLFEMLESKEMIVLEGVESAVKGEPSAYYFTLDSKKEKKFSSIKLKKLEEGVIFGVAGSLASRKNNNSVFVFAETHSELPDSRAAAKIIEVLDSYLGLNVDYKPLLEKAEVLEGRLKEIFSKSASAKKENTYLG